MIKIVDVNGVDHVFDEPVEDGDELSVQFPDGTTITAPAVVHQGKAHFTFSIHGLEIDVPLEGMEIRWR